MSSSETFESGKSCSFCKEGPATPGIRGNKGEGSIIDLSCLSPRVSKRAGSIMGSGAEGVRGVSCVKFSTAGFVSRSDGSIIGWDGGGMD